VHVKTLRPPDPYWGFTPVEVWGTKSLTSNGHVLVDADYCPRNSLVT